MSHIFISQAGHSFEWQPQTLCVTEKERVILLCLSCISLQILYFIIVTVGEICYVRMNCEENVVLLTCRLLFVDRKTCPM